MNKFSFIAAGVVLLALCACSGPPEPETYNPNPVIGGEAAPETPPPDRIADLLQESKQQYDDFQYETSFRLAEQAIQLMTENNYPEDEQALALTIQGYSLLQLGRVDDYFVSTFGTQKGAITKFNAAIKLRPDSFRAQLGIGLAQFRRHGDAIRKAEALGSGIILLESIREDFRRAMDPQEGDDTEARLREAVAKFTNFKSNRDKLVELGYIFRDPSTVPLNKDGSGPEAKWLGSADESKETLAVKDMGWILDDAAKGTSITEHDRTVFHGAASTIAESWRKVRKYWRLQGLKDLQESRDRLLATRRQDAKIAEDMGRMVYFWVDRDLTFVFQSLGSFFMDSGMAAARLMAISEGVTQDRLEARAKEIYLSEQFTTVDKKESQRNFIAALTYTESFVRRHREFEDLRRRKVDEVQKDDANGNPFLVDLVSRYQQTMDELIEDEQNIRGKMILEAASLCIDPLFQINDLEKANVWAGELKAMNPDEPLHHFVRATAYFSAREWEMARDEYQAFLNVASISKYARRRTISRSRIMQCETNLSKSAGAGEDDRR